MDSSWIAWTVAALATLLLLRERRAHRKNLETFVHWYKEIQAHLPAEYANPFFADATTGAPADRAPAKKHRSKGAPVWQPADARVTVAGRRIGGMVYVGPAGDMAPSKGRVGAAIDPSQPVARTGTDVRGDGVPYWPKYERLGPESRASYLDWLATGRSDPNYGVGYMFLYFYGLEHRFFLGPSGETERKAIVTEVKRLSGIYGANQSVRVYVSEFLDAAALHLGAGDALEPTFQPIGKRTPLRVQYAVGRAIQRREPVPADWLLSWVMTNSTHWSVRMPAKRALPEFRALFGLRLAEKYRNGLKVPVPRKKLSVEYQAASGEFAIDLSARVPGLPDITGLTKPVRQAVAVANAACDELTKFSRYLSINPEGRDHISGHLLLPAPIRPHFECAELETLHAWVAPHLKDRSPIELPALLERLEGNYPLKATKKHLVRAAESLALVSVGMAPDPRYALRPVRSNEPAFLFALPNGDSAADGIGDGYRIALLSVTAGAYIAHAGGGVSATARARLEDLIDRTDGLTAADTARLRADIDWLAAVAPALPTIRAHLGKIDPAARAQVVQPLAALASTQGRLKPASIRAVQSLYKAAGMPDRKSSVDLHNVATGGPPSQPVTVRQPAKSRSGHQIPPRRGGRSPAPRQERVELDPNRLKKVVADTERASSVLKDVFSDEDGDKGSDRTAPEGGDRRPSPEGLDDLHERLRQELISRPAWSRAEFDELTAKFGLMPSGALETLNEWAYERFDEALVEEDDELQVNEDVVAQLRKSDSRGA